MVHLGHRGMTRKLVVALIVVDVLAFTGPAMGGPIAG